MQILHQTCNGKDKPECQDIVRTEIIKVNQQEDLIILCLSDGAGSAVSAKEGATLTTTLFIEEIKSYISNKLANQSISQTNFPSDFIIDSTVMRNLIISTRIRVESQIGFKKDSIKDYNCTFASLVYLHNHIENCGYGYSCSIGDSLIIGIQDEFTLVDNQNEDQTFRKSKSYKVLNKIVKGEYANTTVFFTGHRWYDALQIEKCYNLIGAILSSDGLDNVYFKYLLDQEIHNEIDPIKKWAWRVNLDDFFINKLFESLLSGFLSEDKLLSILSSDKIMEINNDDKSLIIAKFINNAK